MAFTDEQLEIAIRNADAAGRKEDVQALSVEYNRRKADTQQPTQPEVTQPEVEQIYAEDILAYTGAVPFKGHSSDSFQQQEGVKIYDPNLSLAENAKLIVYDANNQFNRALLNTAGLPVDLIGQGVAKVKGKILGGEYESANYSQSLRDVFNTVEEDPRTVAGYITQTAGEATTAGLTAIKGAQVLSKALKPVSTVGKGTVTTEIADQFVKEATENTGRFLAVETGAFTLAGAARAAANEADLSPGASLAVEVLAGIAGGFAGYGAYNVPRSLLNKVKNKNATEIVEMVANGTIKYDELEWVELKSKPLFKEDGTFSFDESLPVSQSETRGTMPGIVQETMDFDLARRQMAESVANKQKAEAANSLTDLNNYKPNAPKNPKRLINKILKTFAPSKLLGREITNEIDMARGTINRVQELGARVMRVIGRLEKTDSTITDKVDDFINGGEMHSDLKPIEIELIKWRESIREMQNKLLSGMDDEVFEGLSTSERTELKDVIQASIEKGNYLTKTYKAFQDPNYLPTSAQEEAALLEIRNKIFESADKGTMTLKSAEDQARKQINYLRKNFARQKKLDGRQQGVVKESKGILRERTNPGPAERAWLGEVTDPKERAFSTAKRLSQLAASKAEDIAIARLLLSSKMATRQQVRPDQVQMRFRTIDGESKIFIDPEVNDAVDFLRFGNLGEKTRSGIGDFISRTWNSWVGGSKATKVLFNPESYSVNLIGAVSTTVASGINPFNFKGFRSALSDFGSLDEILSGKNPKLRRAFLDDIDKMNQYGLKPKSVNVADLEQNVIRGLTSYNEALKKGVSGVMDWFGKLYSVGDTSMRYVVWKGNQKQLRKMFPDYSNAEIEAAAARLTNDTFQNYDKLSNVIRQISRFGGADQFVPFTAELTRNTYNQGKYAMKMMTGTFGKDIGLDPSRAAKKTMALTGLKRGSALLAVTAGTDALITEYNQLKGITKKDEDEFGFSIAPEWDSNKRLIIIPDATGRAGRYVNPSYLVPQAIVAEAFDAGFSGAPMSELPKFFKEQYMGEPGTFPARSLGQIIFGRDLNGKLLSVDPRTSQKTLDAIDVIYDETLRPGAQRTFERWSDSLSGRGDRTVKDNALRMLGVRDYLWNASESFGFKLREVSEPMRQAKSEYSSALRKFENNQISREELNSEYERTNTARRLQMDIMRQHYRNLGGGTWKFSQDERILMMKEAGVGTQDILDVIENTYTDIPIVKSQTTADIYNEIEGDREQIESALRDIAKDDPDLAEVLIKHHRRMIKIENSKISEKDKLIRKLSPQKRVDRLIDMGAHKNRELRNEMLNKGIANKEILQMIYKRTGTY
tara:strand:+ start:980 stop:4960 length:3981 start_codon:yes stop_codon:yes gene_type:complete